MRYEMNDTDRGMKLFLINHLIKSGYETYSNILKTLKFQLLDPKSDDVAYITEDELIPTVAVNGSLDIDCISVILRHEILHYWLEHGIRSQKFAAQQLGFDLDNLTPNQVKEITNFVYGNQKSNIAADYEISNRGYTDKDKEIARNIKLGNDVVCGLVTEDKHPDWLNLTYEEMYERLLQEKDDDIKNMIKDMPQMPIQLPPSMQQGEPQMMNSKSGKGSPQDSSSNNGSDGQGSESDSSGINFDGDFIDDHTFVTKDGKIINI